MKVIIGADHAATELKETLKTTLRDAGYAVEDVSPSLSQADDDYPTYAFAVAAQVAADPEYARGILACDTGIGMAIAANKVRGVRAALVTSEYGARRAREHNNANILVFGAELITPADAVRAAQVFLETSFTGDARHVRRLSQIDERDRR